MAKGEAPSGARILATKSKADVLVFQSLQGEQVMHFSDLAPCHYHSGIFDPANWSVPLVAIGWLEAPHPFPRGDLPDAVVTKLSTQIQQSWPRYRKYPLIGGYSCSFCDAELGRSSNHLLPQFNLFVPGNEVIYVTPSGIIHYIRCHQYAPPAEFLEAVLQCPPADSSEYLAALRKANRGAVSPLEPDFIYNPTASTDAKGVWSAVVSDDCTCTICGKIVPACTPIFVAFDWPDVPPEYESIAMHWECYAYWPQRQAFAEARLQNWVAREKESADWGTVWQDDTMLVMACLSDRFPEVCVLLGQTGTRRGVPLEHWSTWLAAQIACPKGVHPVEAAALAAVLPTLQAQLPTAEVIRSRVDYQAKKELRLRQEQERAEREAAYLARFQDYNQHCAERWKQLTACPFCQGEELRFTDGKTERKSFIQCLVCDRTFGPDDIENVPQV